MTPQRKAEIATFVVLAVTSETEVVDTSFGHSVHSEVLYVVSNTDVTLFGILYESCKMTELVECL